jgi:hypothetical protein
LDTVGHYHSEPSPDGEASCYERLRDALELVHQAAPALSALTTTATTAPARSDASSRSIHEPTLEPDEVERRRAIMRAEGGVSTLGIPMPIQRPLREAGVLTVAEVQRRFADGSIADVSGLGQSRLRTLQAALSRWARAEGDDR